MNDLRLWTYRARHEKVIDGDTIDVTVDCGFRSYRTERLRITGVDTPEQKGATLAAGRAATAYVKDWLGAAGGEWPLVIVTEKSDAFGRFIAHVYRAADGACLNDDLLRDGIAVPYDERPAAKKAVVS